MKKTILPLLLLSTVFIYSCHEQKAKPIEKPESKKILTVSEFNSKLLQESKSLMSNHSDIQQMDSLLNVLSKHNITLCQFVDRLYSIDDSCMEESRKKYPSDNQFKEYNDLHQKIVRKAEDEFLLPMNLSKKDGTFAVLLMEMEPQIKNFCITKH